MTRPTHLEAHTSEYWEDMYWKVVSQFGDMQHAVFRAKDLATLNHTQARRIMELELLLSCLTRVGDTVIVEHDPLMKTIHLLPDTKKYMRLK